MRRAGGGLACGACAVPPYCGGGQGPAKVRAGRWRGRCMPIMSSPPRRPRRPAARSRRLWTASRRPVGADNAVSSRDLRILVDQAAEPVASSDADVAVRGRDGDLAVRWLLAEGPVPVGVVMIDVFAEGVVGMSWAGDKDAVGALAPRAGDPPLADRVILSCPVSRCASSNPLGPALARVLPDRVGQSWFSAVRMPACACMPSRSKAGLSSGARRRDGPLKVNSAV
jgi:hypothetical protein